MPNPERKLFIPVESAATDQEFVKNPGGETNLALDSSDSYRLKFNQNGTIRTVVTATGGQTQTSPVMVTPVVQGAEGANAVLNINADKGNDLADQWDIQALAASATLEITNAATTAKFQFVAGSASVLGTEAGNAALVLDADEGDDLADTWTIQSTASDNDLDFINHTTTVASITSAGALSVVGVTNTGACAGLRRAVSVTSVAGPTALSTAQSGVVVIATAGSGTQTFTLPAATTAGLIYTFVAGDAAGEILVNPSGTDTISIKASEGGANVTTVGGTGIKNTAASNVKNDHITVVADGTSAWYAIAQSGTWASQ